MTESPLSSIDWEDVLYTLREHRCLLFLGPGAYKGPEGGDLEAALSKYLDAENPEHPHIRLYKDDGFFLFRKNRYQRRVASRIREFYHQPFAETEAMFGKLARIPFPIVFLINPDNLLTQTFDNLGLDYQWDFYFRHRKASSDFESPNGDHPLIYNILGNIEEPESLVLTHHDFFDYLESAFKSNSMNQELQDELEEAERFIFLGLPYEKWYFQLLMRVLALHSDRLKEAERLALQEFEDPRLGTLYNSDFKMEFVPGKVEGFIDALYQKCEAAGMLKSVTEVEADSDTPFDADAIKLKVAEAETGKAMEMLRNYLISRRPASLKLDNELVVLRNRYNLLTQRERKGTIYAQDFQVENNQIVEALMDLIQQTQAI